MVALITVRGSSATLALPPTRDAALAQRKLKNLPVGGKTPLPDGLLKALTLARAEIRRDSEVHPVLVIFAEGHANVSKTDNVMVELEEAAAAIAKNGFPTIVLDPEGKGTREGLAKSLAQRLRAAYIPLKGPDAREMTAIIRDALDRLG
jgi:magnesium chelatase subunit D